MRRRGDKKDGQSGEKTNADEQHKPIKAAVYNFDNL
jgi:hypothetical protein